MEDQRRRDNDHGLHLGELSETIAALQAVGRRRVKSTDDLPLYVKQLWQEVEQLRETAQFGEGLKMDFGLLKPSDRNEATEIVNKAVDVIEKLFDLVDQIQEADSAKSLQALLNETQAIEDTNALTYCHTRLSRYLDLLQM
jgi:hypothetical protein